MLEGSALHQWVLCPEAVGDFFAMLSDTCCLTGRAVIASLPHLHSPTTQHLLKMCPFAGPMLGLT